MEVSFRLLYEQLKAVHLQALISVKAKPKSKTNFNESIFEN